MNRALALAYNERDLERMTSLYEKGARIITRWGENVGDAAAICATLARMMSFDGMLRATNKSCHVQGDLALVCGEWALRRAIDVLGQEFSVSAHVTQVLRKHLGGRWRVVIEISFPICGYSGRVDHLCR